MLNLSLKSMFWEIERSHRIGVCEGHRRGDGNLSSLLILGRRIISRL
jgi:hypothetical protein